MKPLRQSQLAFETWELVFELLLVARPRVPAAAARCGLTAAQSHVLRLLRPDAFVSMRCVAERLGCDASNVTGIVDRLEARGLVQRRASEQDRRVKEVALTPAGVRARDEILAHLGEPPEPIARLSSEDQRALCALMRKALQKRSTTDHAD